MNRSTRTILLVLTLILFGSVLPARAQPSGPSDSAPARVYLPMLANGASTALPDSNRLIDQAIAAGTLEAQTGLLYKIYAAFDDPRLPAPYRGSGQGAAVPALTAASEALETLRPEIRSAIAPFLLPPNAPGSWLDLRENGQSQLRSASAAAKAPWLNIGPELLPKRPYRIWFRPGLGEVETVRAMRVLAAMDNHIWPRLTALMGTPRPDSGFVNNGAGPEFDIYLVDNLSKTVPYQGKGCSENAAFVLLNTNHVDEDALAAHVMLATLYGYKVGGCREYGWLFQASGVWAADHVYPDSQKEHAYARDFLDNPHHSLEDDHNEDLLAPLSNIGMADTGQYLLPFYLARKLGQPEQVRAMWDAASNRNSLAAINGVLQGGFAQTWPEFALANWNRPPYDDYTKLDNLTLQAKPIIDQAVNIGGQGQVSYDLAPADVPHLGARYYRFTFSGDDARGVMFFNGWTYNLQKGPEGAYSFEPIADERKQGAHIQALFKINGVWQPAQDWTNQPFGFFCRDRQAEHVEELTLIVSNSEWQNRKHVLEPAGEAPKLAVSNIGCHKWEGTITYKNTANDIDWPGFSQYTIVTQGVWNAIPKLPDDADPTGSLFAAYAFEPVGEVSVEEVYERYVQGEHGPVVECGGTARGKTTLAGNQGYLRIAAALFPDDPSARYYQGEGTTHVEMIMPACENGNEIQEFGFWRLPENARFTVEPNGTLIRGSWSQDCSDDFSTCSESYSWELRAQRE